MAAAEGKIASTPKMRNVIQQLEKINQAPPTSAPGAKPKPTPAAGKPPAAGRNPTQAGLKPAPSANKPLQSPAANKPAVGFKLPAVGEAGAGSKSGSGSPVDFRAGLKPVSAKPALLEVPSGGSAPTAAVSDNKTPPTHPPFPTLTKPKPNFPPKPTEPPKSPKPSSVESSHKIGNGPSSTATVNATSTTDETKPPWQSLIRKKPSNGSVTSPQNGQQATGGSAEQVNTAAEQKPDDEPSRLSKVQCLRLTFEGPSSPTSAAVSPAPSDTLHHRPNKLSAARSNEPEAASTDRNGTKATAVSGDVDYDDDLPPPPASASISGPGSSAGSASQSATTKRSYRQLPLPTVTGSAPRKPAKPPRVDLSVFCDGEEFDEIYDDAAPAVDTNATSGTTTSVSIGRAVSIIAEFTEEEELSELRKRRLLETAQYGDGDEIYDDVGNAEVPDDEIYQELD